MRTREAVFGAVAALIVIIYLALGTRFASLLLPAGAPTPTPARPSAPVDAPRVAGTIAFALGGDIFVLRGGRYAAVTAEGRSLAPNLSPDGRSLLFERVEQIEGARVDEGQTVPARLHFTNIVRKDSAGGPETIALTGLRLRAANGFHAVSFFDTPALAPDGNRFAVVEDDGDGASDLEIWEFAPAGSATASRRTALLSQGANLADPAWSPDGKTVAVTSYTLGVPRLLLVGTDGRAATPVKGVPDGEPYRASYSADGSWLIYTLRHDGRNDLHALNVATARDVALTSDGRSWNGVFSPDARSVAFLREQGGVIDLYAMELGTSLAGGAARDAVKLTRGEGVDGQSRPAWGGPP